MNTKELVQGSKEWLEARVGMITGSMIGQILGVSPFGSRKAALKRMVKEAMGDLSNFSSPAMTWGTEHEDEVARLYTALYAAGEEVVETGFWVKGDIGASPDRLIGDRGLLEIKCPYSKRHDERPQWGEISKDGTLAHYWHQVQAQLYVTDRDWCDFLQWTPHDHHMVRVYRDVHWIEDNAGEFAEFMGEFDDMRHQMASGGPSERLALSEGWAEASLDYAAARKAADIAARHLDEAKSRLVAMMEAAEVDEVEGSGVKVSFVGSRGSIDYKKMAEGLAGADFEKDAEAFRRSSKVSVRINVKEEG